MLCEPETSQVRIRALPVTFYHYRSSHQFIIVFSLLDLNTDQWSMEIKANQKKVNVIMSNIIGQEFQNF